MKIALIDVDGHNFPSLPLMKISAWHKNQGDRVEWYEPLTAWRDGVGYLQSAEQEIETPTLFDFIGEGGHGERV